MKLFNIACIAMWSLEPCTMYVTVVLHFSLLNYRVAICQVICWCLLYCIITSVLNKLYEFQKE